ncbi:MAG: hypothetical protein ACLR0W_01985 [Lachnospira sp.]
MDFIFERYKHLVRKKSKSHVFSRR